MHASWAPSWSTRTSKGNLTVEETDHAVEEGAAGLAGVGFVVGLFAPPLLAATAIGAAIGAVGGEALHKKLGAGIGGKAGDTIPIGGAGLIVAYPHSAAEKVEPAVTRAVKKVVGEAEGHHVAGPQGRARRRPEEDGRRRRIAAGVPEIPHPPAPGRRNPASRGGRHDDGQD